MTDVSIFRFAEVMSVARYANDRRPSHVGVSGKDPDEIPSDDVNDEGRRRGEITLHSVSLHVCQLSQLNSRTVKNIRFDAAVCRLLPPSPSVLICHA